MAPDGTLDIRTVDVAWSNANEVYVCEGLSDGEMLVTSDLAAPVQGMAVRTPNASTAPGAPTRTEPETKEVDHAG
jgi:hypothetical protein